MTDDQYCLFRISHFLFCCSTSKPQASCGKKRDSITIIGPVFSANLIFSFVQQLLKFGFAQDYHYIWRTLFTAYTWTTATAYSIKLGMSQYEEITGSRRA